MSDQNEKNLKELLMLMIVCEATGFKNAKQVIKLAMETLSLMVTLERVER